MLLRMDEKSITSNTITDIRQIESILCEISSNYSSMSNNNSPEYHINRDKDHIIEAISDIKQNDVAEIHSSDLENTFIPKNRRRYNVITQIMAIKTHLISPASYRYLQGLNCLSLPHVHTLDKLYSSFDLENAQWLNTRK